MKVSVIGQRGKRAGWSRLVCAGQLIRPGRAIGTLPEKLSVDTDDGSGDADDH